MLTSIVSRPINHVLDGESWACKRLQVYTGKAVRIRVLPLFNLCFSIQIDGKVINITDNDNVDAVITLTPATFIRIMANDQTVFNEISISGNNVFAKELINIGRHLNWDVEQDLSGIVGDIFSYRIVQTTSDLVHWPVHSIHNLSQAVAEYWMEEQPMLVSKILVNEFGQNIEALQLEIEQLELRIQRLIDQKN